MSGEPWYRELFGDLYLRSYQEVLAQMDPVQEVDFLVRRLALEPGMRVLDLCCGQGRHAVEIARRGLRVTGQDLSPTLLSKTREAAEAGGVNLELIERDMREIPWEKEFHAVLNLFTAFGYFEEDRENFRVLEGVARALRPGGRFAIDLISYAWLMRHWEATGWRRGEGGLLSLDGRGMDWRSGLQTMEHLSIEPDGSRRAITCRIRLFPSHELVAWLERAGLAVEELLGGLDGSPFGLESKRLVVIAQRPA